MSYREITVKNTNRPTRGSDEAKLKHATIHTMSLQWTTQTPMNTHRQTDIQADSHNRKQPHRTRRLKRASSVVLSVGIVRNRLHRHLFIVFFERGKIFARLAEFSFLHPLSHVPAKAEWETMQQYNNLGTRPLCELVSLRFFTVFIMLIVSSYLFTNNYN